MKHVAIRTDASLRIGTGHVMRCLALASAQKERGTHVTFLSREHQGHLIPQIQAAGFDIISLSKPSSALPPADAAYTEWLGTSWQEDAKESLDALKKHALDWMIVDHYAIDKRWESQIAEQIPHVLAIDDLANREHDCKILVDTGFHANSALRYQKLVPTNCKVLYGPRYLFLRDEFIAALKKRKARQAPVKQLLVFFGGADPENLTGRLLNVLEKKVFRSWSLAVVGGATNVRNKEHRDRISSWEKAVFYDKSERMAELIQDSTLAFGGGGVGAWERALLGLPTITVPWANNQREVTHPLARAGAIDLVEPDMATEQHFSSRLERYLSHPEELETMSQRALKFTSDVDGLGREAVIDQMLGVAA